MSRQGEECGDYSYYNRDTSSCSQCDHLCDNHQIQDTTSQCIHKCYKYYQRMQQIAAHTTTQIPSVHRSSSHHPPIPEGARWTDTHVFIAALVPLLGLCIIAAVILWIMRKKNHTCCGWGKERKTAVLCCEEEGIDQVAESQKSLLNSNGPIRQAEENPNHEPALEAIHVCDRHSLFGTMDIPHRVLDGPPRNIYTLPPRAYTEHSTNIVSSTVPNAYTYSQYASNAINRGSSTTPKVVYTNGEESEMDSSRTGTIA